MNIVDSYEVNGVLKLRVNVRVKVNVGANLEPRVYFTFTLE